MSDLMIDVNQMLEYIDNPLDPSDAAAGPSMVLAPSRVTLTPYAAVPAVALSTLAPAPPLAPYAAVPAVALSTLAPPPLAPYAAVPAVALSTLAPAPPLAPYAAVPAVALSSICWGALLSGNGCRGPGYTGGPRHFKNRFCARCQAQGVRIAASRVRLLAPGAAPETFRKADTLINRSVQGTWTSTGFSSPEWFRVLNHTKGCTGPACVLFSESIKSPPDHGALSDERLRANGLYPIPGREPTVLFNISRGTLVPDLPVALLFGRPEPLLWARCDEAAPAASGSAGVMQSMYGSPDRDDGDAHLDVLDPAALASVQQGVARFQTAATALTASRGVEHFEPSSLKRKRAWLQVRTVLTN